MEKRFNYERDGYTYHLTAEEVEKLENQNWLYDHENDVLILKDEDEVYSIFEGIEHKTPDNWIIHFGE